MSPEILSRTIFHGQHSLHGLLESTDAKPKEGLSLVVPLDAWRDGAAWAQAEGGELSKRESELGRMVRIRMTDVEALRRRVYEAQDELFARARAFREKDAEVRATVDQVRRSPMAEKAQCNGASIELCGQRLDEAPDQVQTLDTLSRGLVIC